MPFIGGLGGWVLRPCLHEEKIIFVAQSCTLNCQSITQVGSQNYRQTKSHTIPGLSPCTSINWHITLYITVTRTRTATMIETRWEKGNALTNSWLHSWLCSLYLHNCRVDGEDNGFYMHKYEGAEGGISFFLLDSWTQSCPGEKSHNQNCVLIYSQAYNLRR